MTTPVVVALIILLVILLAGGAYFFIFGANSSGGFTGTGSTLMSSSRPTGMMSGSGTGLGGTGLGGTGMGVAGQQSSRGGSLLDSAAKTTERRSNSKLTLKKKLKYAQLTLPPSTYYAAEIAISLVAMGFVSLKCHYFLVILSALVGPAVCGGLLQMAIDKRFKQFDADYPSFLLSVVALLKTGMNPIGALEAAAGGLTETSLVRQEVEMMVERLRFGVAEDKSIGEFGSDILHPEIELFVQALLLSMRVGGTLSDTLERLARQVRKRQFFRSSARAAIGLQRGSIWVILGILSGLEVYLYIVYPESVVGAIKDPSGWLVWQFSITLIIIGIYWLRQVTKIKT